MHHSSCLLHAPHRINAVDSTCEGLDQLRGIPTRVPQRVYVAIYIIHQMYTTHIRRGGDATARVCLRDMLWYHVFCAADRDRDRDGDRDMGRVMVHQRCPLSFSCFLYLRGPSVPCACVTRQEHKRWRDRGACSSRYICHRSLSLS